MFLDPNPVKELAANVFAPSAGRTAGLWGKNTVELFFKKIFAGLVGK